MFVSVFVQMLLQHCWLALHVRPQAPQCATDDEGSTHELLQQSIGATQGAPLPHWQ